eukprot:7133754-Prymnesium_polylepis.1
MRSRAQLKYVERFGFGSQFGKTILFPNTIAFHVVHGVSTVLVLAHAFFWPMELSFGYMLSEDVSSVLLWIADVFWWMMIVINFRTAITMPGDTLPTSNPVVLAT